MKRIIGTITGIVISACLIVALANFHSGRQSRRLADELSEGNKSLKIKIAAVREQLTARSHDEETLQAALQEAQTSKQPAITPLPKPAPAQRAMADLMETRPALRTLFKQSSRANLVLSHLPFYDAAHLSPGQIDKFEELMTENEQDRLDLQAVAKAQGLVANDPALVKMQQLSDQKLQSAQKEILGDAGYQELQRYNRKTPTSGFMTSFASGLAYNASPLTVPQCARLLSVMSEASSEYKKGGVADYGSIDVPQVLQQAETILTPAQLTYFKASTHIISLMKLRNQFYQERNAAAK